MGVFPCSLPLPSGFGGRAESEVRTGYAFPQSALAAVTLVGHKAGDGGDIARASCDPGLPPGLMAVATLKGEGLRPKGLE